MNFLIFQQTNNFEDFVNVWSQLYNHNSPWEDNYLKHIKPDKPFTHKDIMQLFEWQSQCGLGKIRIAAIKDKIYPELDYINDMKFEETIDLQKFHEKFSSVAAVSRIFLLHIIKPEFYPLFDQNIHVAYNFIHGIDSSTYRFSVSTDDRLKFYFKHLFPFIKSVRGNLSLKKIDEALNTYGQLVKRNPTIKI